MIGMHIERCFERFTNITEVKNYINIIFVQNKKDAEVLYNESSVILMKKMKGKIYDGVRGIRAFQLFLYVGFNWRSGHMLI